ncbi:MAG: acyl carrier protein [Candidatus Omnitrophica bacterium]|nr:acyl carrier protein [Candidatus Omnitrophota bacterium]MDD5237991.1 acyl carrier protein [Candidatus Omnitrophota bacterium]
MEIRDKIRGTLVKLLSIKPEELKDDVSLQDSIGVDSTEMIEAVIALEKEFGTKLSPKDITKFSTLQDIESVIKGKTNQ